MILIKKNLILIFYSILLGVFLISCGGPKIKVAEVDVPVVEKNECILDETPKWYTEYPDDKDKDGNVVKSYHVGYSENETVEHAKSNSIYEAQKSLGQSINARMNSRSEEFLAFEGSDTIAAGLEEAIKRVVKDVSVGGYVIQETHLSTCSSIYFQAWTLLEYDLDNEKNVLVEEVNKEPDLAIELRRSQAFQELEEELNNQ